MGTGGNKGRNGVTRADLDRIRIEFKRIAWRQYYLKKDDHDKRGVQAKLDRHLFIVGIYIGVMFSAIIEAVSKLIGMFINYGYGPYGSGSDYWIAIFLLFIAIGVWVLTEKELRLRRNKLQEYRSGEEADLKKEMEELIARYGRRIAL